MLFAILGSHPALSLAEWHAVTGTHPQTAAGIAALFPPCDANLNALAAQLGGTQKIGHVIGELPGHAIDDLATFLVAQLEQEHAERKKHFGISVYDFGDAAAVARMAKTMQHVGMTVKTLLQQRGVSTRFVMAKDAALNAVTIAKNNLLTKGAEFVVLVARDRLVIGTTASVQDAEGWSTRDFGRPRRNAKQGMLPPKLARMMLNMTGKPLAGTTLLDPFCGSGTVLMEGAMLGAGKLLGGDVAGGAIRDARENLAWLQKTVGVTVPPTALFTSSAAKLNEHLAPNSVDVLVTETYLGRPRRGTETEAEIKEAIAYIETLYRESFGGLRNLLKGDAVVVLAAPVHILDAKTYEPAVENVLGERGFVAQPITDAPLIYRREGQYVGRRFYRFLVK